MTRLALFTQNWPTLSDSIILPRLTLTAHIATLAHIKCSYLKKDYLNLLKYEELEENPIFILSNPKDYLENPKFVNFLVESIDLTRGELTTKVHFDFTRCCIQVFH